MPSGQTIINNALAKLSINELGGTTSASDSNSALSELNNMWGAWGIDEGLIFAQQAITKALTANVGSYTIGTGAAFNTPLPTRVYKATVFTTGNRTELEIVNADRYYSHNDLAAAAGTPDELYPDFNVDPATGYAKIYLWPIQTGTPTLELVTGAPFAAWTLAGVVILPLGYQDPIEWSLAWRLISSFGMIVPQQIAETVSENAMKAEARIREMNAINRKLAPPVSVNPQAQQAAASQPQRP